MKPTTLAAAALAMGLSGLALTAPAKADLWFHLTVDEQRGDRAHVKVHLPLRLVERLAPLLVLEAQPNARLRINDRDITPAEARELWRALRDAGDAPFIDVRSGRERVRVSRRGGFFHLESLEDRGRDERAEIRIPESVVEALLSGEEGRYEFAAALKALARQGAGDLVTITADDADVRVWIDGNRPPEE